MKLVKNKLSITVFVVLFLCLDAFAQQEVKVGVPTVLSGDLAVLGSNIINTFKTFEKHYKRHNIRFIYEDAKLGSKDGLAAYQKLINVDRVDMVVNVCSSNCLIAAGDLINRSKTPTISIVTGGGAVDRLGDYVFRLGNDDALNGIQLAEHLFKSSQMKVALLTEETEYSLMIGDAFSKRFKELNGRLTYNASFDPKMTDFRPLMGKIKAGEPQVLVMLTQTGMALGLFIKQWHELNGPDLPIHTTFVAAPNSDAHVVAGPLIDGVYYYAPDCARDGDAYRGFLDNFRNDNKRDPMIDFHAAGAMDALELLQRYLDIHKIYDRKGFKDYLLGIKDFKGLMGSFSFDSDGNAHIGYSLEQIKYQQIKN